jgi:hypothetical protein
MGVNYRGRSISWGLFGMNILPNAGGPTTDVQVRLMGGSSAGITFWNEGLPARGPFTAGFYIQTDRPQISGNVNIYQDGPSPRPLISCPTVWGPKECVATINDPPSGNLHLTVKYEPSIPGALGPLLIWIVAGVP